MQVVARVLKHTCTAALFTTSTWASAIATNPSVVEDIKSNTGVKQICRAGLIGFPNAGKSQLTNHLTGVKVSAVSRKQHTTREPQLGAFSEGNRQVVLYDTPGFDTTGASLEPSEKQRVTSAWQTAQYCGVLLFIVDAEAQYRIRHPAIYAAAAALTSGPPRRLLPPGAEWAAPPTALVLNKIDKLDAAVQKLALDVLEERLLRQHPFERVFRISALRGLHVTPVRKYLLSKAVPGEWEFGEGQATDKDPAELAAEVVREKLYHVLHAHLPYLMNPVPEHYAVLPDGTHRILLVLPVESLSMKKIVVGTKGRVLQEQVVVPAQQELEDILAAAVQLRVEVLLQPRQGRQ